ncbi:hypothetical protein ACHAW5_011119 [Stephanodiscus triporus]|uniref:Uncharacterized protein n=1 Tax=Stephanodiscus triporus TaxID=2934178 RepID=A0ABD3P6S7_9STRA
MSDNGANDRAAATTRSRASDADVAEATAAAAMKTLNNISSTRAMKVIHKPRDNNALSKDSYLRRLHNERMFHQQLYNSRLEARAGVLDDGGGPSLPKNVDDHKDAKDEDVGNNTNDTANWPASAVALEAREGGKGVEGEHPELQITTASPRMQKSMLDVICDVASSIGDIPVATPWLDTAATEIAKKDETAADAGMVAADAAADIAITAKGNNSSPQSTRTNYSQKSKPPLTPSQQPEDDESLFTTKKIKIGTTSDDSTAYGLVHTPNGFRTTVQQQQQQQAHYHHMALRHHAYSQPLVPTSAMIMPQYQQPREADDDKDDGGRLSSASSTSRFVVPAVAHKPMPYPPISHNEQPIMSSPPGFPHPQHLSIPPGYVFSQPPSSAHHQLPMMMTPGVFSPGYVQLQLTVPLQQQMMMAAMNATPPGFLPDQPQQADDVGLFSQQHIPHQAYMNPPLYQQQGKHHFFPVQHHQQLYAGAPAAPITLAKTSLQQQRRRQQPADIVSPRATKSPPSNPSPKKEQSYSPESSNAKVNANIKPSKRNAPTVVHRPYHDKPGGP